MKLTIYILIGIFVLSLVCALEQPISRLGELSQPVAPSTGTQGECTPWEITDAYCSGSIRHYTQCVKTVSGGTWQVKSEDCTKDFPENVCFNGKCMKPSEKEKLTSEMLLLVIGALILIIFYISWRKKK